MLSSNSTLHYSAHVLLLNIWSSWRTCPAIPIKPVSVHNAGEPASHSRGHNPQSYVLLGLDSWRASALTILRTVSVPISLTHRRCNSCCNICCGDVPGATPCWKCTTGSSWHRTNKLLCCAWVTFPALKIDVPTSTLHMQMMWSIKSYVKHFDWPIVPQLWVWTQTSF